MHPAVISFCQQCDRRVQFGASFGFHALDFVAALKKGPNPEGRKSLANDERPHFAAMWLFKGDPNYLVSCLNLIVNDVTQLHATPSGMFYLCISCCQLRGPTQQSTLCIKTAEQECRFKSTSCPMSVIQTLISMRLISSRPLHRGRVTARLHIQRPELKLPKASALKR